MEEKGRAWIELSRENLKKNVLFFRKILGKHTKLMPAVKAEAYGHGAVLIAKELQQLGIRDFCVASAEEGVTLREAGIKGQILILGCTYRNQFPLLEKYQLTQTIVDGGYAGELERYLVKESKGGKLRVQLGIDTGMHRLGVDWQDRQELKRVLDCKTIEITGLFSHLCEADGTTTVEKEFTEIQIARFNEAVKLLKEMGLCGAKTHLQGSYGMLNFPECQYDFARPGIALYGILSRHEEQTKIPAELFPVLSLKSRIQSIRRIKKGEGAGYGLAFCAERDSRIAVLSIGYADGIPRNISGKGWVLICAKRAPIVGRICMDQMLVDVTDIPEAEANRETVLIGREGAEHITAEDYAEWSGTIANEIVSRLGKRLMRMWE